VRDGPFRETISVDALELELVPVPVPVPEIVPAAA
jgi:hypothetical protein